MIVRQLIAGLEALGSPDAEVFFVLGDTEVFQVNGGLLDVEDGTGREGILLSGKTLAAEGCF